MKKYMIISEYGRGWSLGQQMLASGNNKKEMIKVLKGYPHPTPAKDRTDRLFLVNTEEFESGNYNIIAELLPTGKIRRG